jgi:hypothetical protein
MRRFCWQLFVVLLVFPGCQAVFAQAASAPAATLIINGRAKTAAKTVVLKKKRFYLFRGDRVANKTLIERLKAVTMTSRDCYYCGLHASTEFMQWLKAGDGSCESVHCREITPEDVTKVPEFQAAYQKGTKQFDKKPELAREWLVTNLEPGFRSGFYDARKAILDALLKDLSADRLPVESAMTDNSAAALANFSGIPLRSGGAPEKFVFSNLIPIEIGEKSYVWVCEVDVGKDKKTPILDAPESSKVVKKCEVIVRDLPACSAGACEQK